MRPSTIVIQLIAYLAFLSDLLKRHVARHETAALPNTRSARACDACHSSKSKCSGVPPCTLCVKRGISCSFSSTKAMASTRRGDEANGAPHTPAPTTSPGETTSSQSPRGLQDVSQINAAFLRALIVQPTSQNGTPSEEQLDSDSVGHHKEDWSPQDGMTTLYEAVKRRTVPCLAQVAKVPVEFRKWTSACCNLYFEQLHFYWPVVHRPTFDERQDALIVSATIVLMGAWLKKSVTLEPLIFETHKLLLDQFFERMVCNSPPQTS